MRTIRLFGVCIVVLLLAGLSQVAARQESPVNPFPNTAEGIHVFNDQINVHHLSDAQIEFAATHYDGSQKLTLSGTHQLRAYNPGFVVLHYRLGLGLGYRPADDNCQPSGEMIAIIRGEDWVQEWPGDDVVQDDWLYRYGGERVYWCAWGWYLADTDNPGWRSWWMGQVLDQLAANENNGLFADSVSVPNYLGADSWRPVLPDVDETFEGEWTHRLNDWMTWARGALGGQYALIVNAGSWVTSRDQVDYSLADGVMIEGFAGWGDYSRFELGDWQLQMDRVSGLIAADKVLILQNYTYDAPERLWVLANYLLIKGEHTYINLETSEEIEWFPEYDLPIGHPLAAAGASVQSLQNEAGLYAREYSGGQVLVNPDPYGPAISMTLDRPLWQVIGSNGGGDVPENADISGWGVQTAEVSQVTVEPGQAMILLNTPPENTAAEITPAPQVSLSPMQTEIAAFHRSGQTFITWTELPGVSTYRVYRAAEFSQLAALDQAELAAEVPQGSGIFWTDRGRAVEPPYDDGAYVSLRNYVITDLGPQLADDTGLFVWTAKQDGDFYYAVVADDGTLIGIAGPVSERISEPQAVLVWQSVDGLSRVYTQFMDYATYNPTFDAPRQGNAYLNLPNWEELEQGVPQQQYAYNYWVGLPAPQECGETVPDTLPLTLHIEGWGGRYTAPDSAPYFCTVMLWADDPSQSWYFGFSATHDYRTGEPALTGPVVNYTEERLMRAVREVLAAQTQPAIDAHRVYVYGHSMGGTGALMLAERYPQVFAAAAASEPMMNFGTAAMWLDELETKWGSRSLNLPVESRGPDAADLARYNGTGVWDWQNLGAQLAARRGDEMAFIAIAHGTLDTVIDWQTVAQPSYAAFYEGRRAFIGEIFEADHTWLGFREHPNWHFEWMDFRLDESFPALSNASGSLPVPPGGRGGYNLTLEWSSSNNDFAGPPLDTPTEWAVTLRSLSGEQMVDVTPRRLQQFAVVPGASYTWQNLRVADNSVIHEGTVTADAADGVLTIVGVVVNEEASRILIRAAPAG